MNTKELRDKIIKMSEIEDVEIILDEINKGNKNDTWKKLRR